MQIHAPMIRVLKMFHVKRRPRAMWLRAGEDSGETGVSALITGPLPTGLVSPQSYPQRYPPGNEATSSLVTPNPQCSPHPPLSSGPAGFSMRRMDRRGAESMGICLRRHATARRHSLPGSLSLNAYGTAEPPLDSTRVRWAATTASLTRASRALNVVARRPPTL